MVIGVPKGARGALIAMSTSKGCRQLAGYKHYDIILN